MKELQGFVLQKMSYIRFSYYRAEEIELSRLEMIINVSPI